MNRSFSRTHIRAVGLACATGDQPFALLGAVATSLSCAIPHPVLAVADLEGEEAAALFAPVPGLEPFMSREERIAALAVEALGNALDEGSEALAEQKILVFTWLPAMDDEDVQTLELLLREDLPALENATFRFVQGQQGVVAALKTLCAELAVGTWETVIFGGADSLVGVDHCRDLLQQGRLMAPHGAEGVFPGEAAAYLVLRADRSGADATTARAAITAAAQAPEPHAGQGGEKKMTGLAQALEEAADQGGIRLDDVEELILTLSTETASQLEWHQTLMRLWPPRGEVDSRDPQLLRPHPVLGELGAATLPVALALGCARFEFEHPPLASLLVCDGSEDGLRGAVCLQCM
ncbi:hypothetical protein [Geoalkalibacter sp.]|uniref:hypothetical protein n=1 Tax=Geoalkalibacter sp. TaxID=3041440 RepID=UPI00272E186D|nr:hypothetical protein [Geoalkalibacter sp.]